MAFFELIPACKEYLWGGTKLITEYNKNYSGDRLGETWELSCHPDGLSVIGSGTHKGQTLRDYIAEKGKDILGSRCGIYEEFPIMIKLIDAEDHLAIQVHPDNEYAFRHEGQYGKTEMWYILEADEEAFLYYGFKSAITKEEFRKRIADGTLLEVLNAVHVKKGDVFYIPAGTVHAIGKGIVTAEIQQSSNVTYRIFDFNRLDADGKPRQLHIGQALDVTNFSMPPEKYDFGGHLVRCPYFTADTVRGPYQGVCDAASFAHILIVEGSGTVSCCGESIRCRKGSSLFITANSGIFSIIGDMEALITRVGTM